MGGKRKTLQDYIDLATERGYEFIGPMPEKVTHLCTWKCGNGHTWQGRFSAIQSGYGCPYCAGLAKKTLRDYQDLAKIRGFTWLGEVLPKNSEDKSMWQCANGHTWQGRYKDIARGVGCPYCAGLTKKTLKDYLELANQRGFEFIGPIPLSIRDKTTWKCSVGHEWEMRFNNIQQGQGCPYCSNRIPKQLEDYYDLAEKRGFKFIGELPETTHHPAQWECNNQHRWSAVYHAIAMGNGCPYCAKVARKTVDDYHDLATQRGFKWLGKELPYRVSDKSVWECSFGHKWQGRYGDILKGTGCPYCAKKARKTEQDYHDLAKKYNLEFIGPKPEKVGDLCDWKCKAGHLWKGRFSQIQEGHGCPHCLDLVNGKKVSKQQRKIAEILGGELNFQAGRYYIDIAFKFNGVNIACEYDSWAWHDGTEEHEKKRDQNLINQGWRVLRIRSNKEIPSLIDLDTAINNLVSGATYTEIVLSDWGKGVTFKNRKRKKQI